MITYTISRSLGSWNYNRGVCEHDKKILTLAISERTRR